MNSKSSEEILPFKYLRLTKCILSECNDFTHTCISTSNGSARKQSIIVKYIKNTIFSRKRISAKVVIHYF